MYVLTFNSWFHLKDHLNVRLCPLQSKAGSTGSQISQECVAETETGLEQSKFSSDLCLKNAIFVSECSEDMCLEKNRFNMYLGDDRAKELVIICDQVHFSRKNEWTQDSFLSPKTVSGRSRSLLTVSG